jgi:aminopeptidase N
MRFPAPIFACAVWLAAACTTPSRDNETAIVMDPHSHAEPSRVRVTHLSLDLDVDFEKKRLAGNVELTLDRRDRAAPLVLDQQALAVTAVTGADGSVREFTVAPEHDKLGSALTIQLAPGDERVRVQYATTDGALALQWLEPAQTAGTRPFLFTQGESVFTRTWIPCQDSPGVRVTYDARIRAATGLTAVMSADHVASTRPGEFRFAMKHPIPSYLIALAVGDIAFEPISKRCGIFAEPSVVKGATAEFSDTETMVQSAERLFGPYRWGRYDLIVLPPAFPFGGMENPCLTFATPTVIAGDKSLVSLVAHELAHSWSGNLVTNATWRDFWLNEGFTVYFEQRIMEAVYGRERALMEAQLSKADLIREMAELAPRDQILHVDLAGRHPDDGFTGIPYTKGALFLLRLEEIFGRERFDAFLTRWFDSHPFQSVTTEQFVAFLDRELLSQDRALAARIDVDTWIEKPGLPADCPNPTSPLLALVDREIAAFTATKDPARINTRGWVTQQWLHFLEGVGPLLDGDQMARLDGAFHLTGSGNSEVLCVWLRLAVQCSYGPADGALESFLMRVGRRKFLEPLYKELGKTPAGLERARAIYSRARPKYHAVSSTTIDGILGWKG